MSRHYLTLNGMAMYTNSDVVATHANNKGWRRIGVKEYSEIVRANKSLQATAYPPSKKGKGSRTRRA